MHLQSCTFSIHSETFWNIKENITTLLLQGCSKTGEYICARQSGREFDLLREMRLRHKTLPTYAKDIQHNSNPPSSLPQPRSCGL